MSPLEYFATQAHGHKKFCAEKIGFNYHYLSMVINKKQRCSKFMASCLIEFSNGAIDLESCDISQKRKNNKPIPVRHVNAYDLLKIIKSKSHEDAILWAKKLKANRKVTK
jgi:hypothetical protein